MEPSDARVGHAERAQLTFCDNGRRVLLPVPLRREAQEQHQIVDLLALADADVYAEEPERDAAAGVRIAQDEVVRNLLSRFVDGQLPLLRQRAVQFLERRPRGAGVEAVIDEAKELDLEVRQHRDTGQHAGSMVLAPASPVS